MNDKDNDLDIILNQYSGKKSDGKALDDASLDAILGDPLGRLSGSAKKGITDDSSDDLSQLSSDQPSEPAQQETVFSPEADDQPAETADSQPDEDEADSANSDEQTDNDEADEDNSAIFEDNTDDAEDDGDDKSVSPKNKDKEKKSKSKKAKKSKKKSRINSSIFVALIVVCIVLTVSFAISIFGINLGMEYLGVGKKDVEITINIPAGSNSSDITKILLDNGIIENEKLFKLILKLKKSGGDLKPGDITLKPVMGYDAIIEALCETRESYEQVQITFPEGITLYDAAQLLQENDVCNSEEFIYSFNSEYFGFKYEDSVTTSSQKYYKFEGFFFPDTYMFYLDDSAYNVTKNMRSEFEKKLQDNDIYAKVEKSGFTMEEAITLASMVQAEAATPEDMKNVASVFINRLKKPKEFPKLQSDATDNYYKNVIVPNNGDATSLAMFEESYNTYIRDGLPAGPVGNPGMDAILAVVDAPETNYYYFCSDLETKKCYFAETLSEHEKNLKKAGIS